MQHHNTSEFKISFRKKHTQSSSKKTESNTSSFLPFRHSKRKQTNSCTNRATKITIGYKSTTPFGHLYAIDDLLREGPNESSKVIGNVQGLYISSSQSEDMTIVMYLDFGFTKGKFKGSSISVFSRNPITEPNREFAVVGGRGKFRLARGFVECKTHFFDPKPSDAILEYHVTVLHY
jgi:hypothetical protein